MYDSQRAMSPAPAPAPTAAATGLENQGTDVQVVPEPRLGDSVPSLTPLQAGTSCHVQSIHHTAVKRYLTCFHFKSVMMS